MEEAQLKIESMAFRGYGVARIDGQVLFVPHSVVGDQGWVKVIQKKKGYAIGRLIKLIKPSPFRSDPVCPLFGQCGGCQWQHIHHPAQIDLKKEILREILIKLAGLKEVPSIEGQPSPQSYGYRSRVQLKVEGKAIGYYRERSHHLVNVDRCPISHPLINQILSLLQKESTSLSQVKEIRINVSPVEGKGVLLLHPTSFHQRMKDHLNDLLKAHPVLKGIAVVSKGGSVFLGDPHLNFTISLTQGQERREFWLRASAKSFSQVNLEMNQILIEMVLQFSGVRKDENVLDLYAGVGNFTLPLALLSKESWGIEENPSAVEDARFNKERNRVTNGNLLHGRVEDILPHWAGPRPQLVILDPPRRGGKAILDQVVRLKPERVIYVSCEPTTFSRDLRLFSEAGYQLQKLGLIDMFPQTYHMEVIGLLTP